VTFPSQKVKKNRIYIPVIVTRTITKKEALDCELRAWRRKREPGGSMEGERYRKVKMNRFHFKHGSKTTHAASGLNTKVWDDLLFIFKESEGYHSRGKTDPRIMRDDHWLQLVGEKVKQFLIYLFQSKGTIKLLSSPVLGKTQWAVCFIPQFLDLSTAVNNNKCLRITE